MVTGDPPTRDSADAPKPREADPPAWISSRATDWRFLLPPTGELGLGRILLVGASDAIATAVRQGGQYEEVFIDRCPPGSADVAVVLRDSDLSAEGVAAMLRPDGVLYWEISRTRRWRLGMTPSAARAALERNGLTPVASYWVTSGAVGPSMHLPLSHDGAVGWYFAVHHGPSSRIRRSLGRVLRTFARGRGDRLERIVPVFALTARRTRSGPVPTDTDARAQGATALAATGLPPWAAAPDARPILLGGGEGPWSRVVLLPFDRHADRPSGVIKVARDRAYEDSINAEQAALASLRAAVPPSIRASLPEPLGLVQVLGQPGSAETYRPGASIAVRSTRRTARQATRKADLGRAAGWLHELHAATATGPMSLGPTGFDIGALSDRYARIFGSDEAEDRLFRRLRASITNDDHHLVPQVMRHRDFGPWNVLVETDGQLSVIDWEMAGPGPPLVDLCYFAAHWCWIVAGSRSERSKARLLRRLVVGERSDWHINASRSVIAGEARSRGLAAEAVAMLFTWTFIEQALDRHDRLQSILDRGAADRASNRYAGYVSVLAEEPDLVDAMAGWLDPDRGTDP